MHRPVQWDVHLPMDQVIYLCACVEVGRISWYICALSDALSEPKWSSDIMPFYASITLSHDLQYTFLNVLMHADLFSGMYTCQGSGDIRCAHVWKLGEFRGTSAHFQTHFQSPSEAVTLYSFMLFCASHTTCSTFLNVLMHDRPVQWDVHLPLDQVIYLCACVEVGRISWYICALSDAFSEQVKQWHYASFMLFCASHTTCVHFFKCSNACRPVQWDVSLPLDQVIYLCACVEVGRISWYICALSDAFSEPKWSSDIMPLLCSFALSHDEQTFLNVLMHADLFSGMYTCHWIRWYTCAHVWKLGEFRGTSAHFQSIFRAQVKQWHYASFMLFCASHTTCSTLAEMF